MTAVAATETKPLGNSAGRAPQGPSNSKKVIRTITEVVLQILLPLASAFSMYSLFPLSVSLIAVPVVTVASSFAVSFLFASGTRFPIERLPLPELPALPATAPRGLVNFEAVRIRGALTKVGNNCWINALAQMIYCDAELKKWFSRLPLVLEANLAHLPVLSPSLCALIPNDAVEAPDLFGFNGQEFQDFAAYVREVHPVIQQCLNGQDAQELKESLRSARSYCQNYFPGLVDADGDQELLAAIRRPEFLAEIHRRDREKIHGYFQIIGQFPEDQVQEAARYACFFAGIPLDNRERTWRALYAFNRFFLAYDAAAGGARIDFHTQALREAVHVFNPLIDLGMGQEDPMEGFSSITGHLIPADLKPIVEKKLYYHLEGKRPIEGALNGNVLIKREVGEPYLPLAIRGVPNIKNLFSRTLDEANHDPESLVDQLGVDGTVRKYLLDRTKIEFVKAPPSLWFQVKRTKNVQDGPWECLTRLFFYWLPGTARGIEKLEIPVEAPEFLEVETQENEAVRYKLDSYILHSGDSTKSGHYISYKLGVDGNGNKAWFEMNDAIVRQLREEEASKKCREAYVYHYSKVNE